MAAAAATLPSVLFRPSPFIRQRGSRLHLFRVSADLNMAFDSPPSSPQLKLTEPSGLIPETTHSALSTSAPSFPMIVPWIVRGEDGNLTLSPSPPPSVLQALALANDAKKNKHLEKNKAKISNSDGKKANTKEKKSAGERPKYSKAARRFYNEHIKESQMQRLCKVLAAAGVASRRSSEELIFDGKVTVNGSICTSPQTKVDIAKDSIYVNGNRLAKNLPPKLYFALNKPKGYICSCGNESKSVVSLFEDFLKSWNKAHPGIPKPRLFTVGRLDVSTTGLIIVTNDGAFAQRLAHPSSQLRKEYIATVDGAVHKRNLVAISNGVEIDGIKCIPDSVELLVSQPNESRSRLRIVVHDGRKHEVRELVKNAGLQLYSLKRVRIGRFKLPADLGIGKYVELKDSDIKLLDGKSKKTIRKIN